MKRLISEGLTLAKLLQSCPTLCDPMDCSPPGASVHGDSPGKNTGVGCCAVLWGIFLTQGLNPQEIVVDQVTPEVWQVTRILRFSKNRE